jgi:hypothetical protein
VRVHGCACAALQFKRDDEVLLQARQRGVLPLLLLPGARRCRCAGDAASGGVLPGAYGSSTGSVSRVNAVALFGARCCVG